ncbi:Mobile element protein [Gammaproteobacteria bacterium]
MTIDMPCSQEQLSNFVELLIHNLPDPRDNRGKRHSLALLIVAFVLATLTGRQKLSSIHRFICNRLDWLHDLTKIPKVRAISRAHLPRLLARLDWIALNQLIKSAFGVHIQSQEGQIWVAIDGKVLRGTLDAGDKQSLVIAITHETSEVVGEARQVGSKSSEIPVVRELLHETELEKQKVSLDAHHCNPETLSQIHQAGGVYLTQVKENQAVLLQQCQALAMSQLALAITVEPDKANGRVTERCAKLFSMEDIELATRWQNSGINVCVVVEREVFEVKTQKTSFETSYYISNQAIDVMTHEATVTELAQAIRKHWKVESNNWIRDVTFNEDKIKTKSGHQAQIMGRLRGFAIALLRKASTKNFQASIDKFADSAADLESMLRQVKFL